MSRLDFYRGPVPEPEGWSDRWPLLALLAALALLVAALAGAGAVALWLDAPARAPAAAKLHEAERSRVPR